jgi:hypothetical protein
MTHGKNARRNNCDESVKEYPIRKRYVEKPRKRWLHIVENDVKKINVTRLEKNS